MEGDHRQYELRSGSRSRSTTPSVQNRILTESESTEHHYDLRRRSRERSRTPGEVTSTRRSGSRSLPGSISKVREHSMETIVEKREECAGKMMGEIHGEKLEETVSAGSKKAERRSERQKAKRQIFANGQSETKEDSSAQMNETLNILECKETIPRALVTSDYSSEEGEREDIPSRPGSAYEIYKQAGDWWNVFPKTDYTYSEKSQCRYEIAPGVLAMPNMSRRPIHSDGNSTLRSVSPINEQKLFHSTQETFDSGLGDTLNTRQSQERSSQSRSSMSESYETLPKSRNWDSAPKSAVFTKTHIEQYKCHREVIYTVPGSSAAVRQRHSSYSDVPPTRSIESSSRRFAVTSDTIDSDTEFEEAISTSVNTLDRRWKITGWFLKFRTFVFLWIGKLFGFLNFRTTDRRREYRTSYEYERFHGIGHESKWSRLGRHIDHSLQYVYLLMVQIFFFDSWLLSRVANVRRTLQERGPKVLWIALLPLLLLTGAYAVEKQSFISLDSLRTIPYDVIQTTYHVLNDIVDFTYSECELIVKYITNVQNSTLNFLPNVNVSLKEMPSIGWNIP